MAILNPIMLLGLLGLTVPVILHLIARHRFPVQDFPSLRLLRLERRTNVFAWRIVDVWQLLLRLLVLALLVLAMSRLFASWLSSAAPQNLAVLIDASASMRCRPPDRAESTLLDMAREQTQDLLATATPAQRIGLLAIGDGVQPLASLGDERARAIATLADVRPAAASGPGLIRGLAEACRSLRGRREACSRIVVFSDMRVSAFAVRQQEDLALIADTCRELGSAWDLVFVDLAPSRPDNLAIVEASLRGGEARVGDDARVLVRVRNEGNEERKAEISLAVGGRDAGEPRGIALPPGGEAVVEMLSPINRALQTIAEARLRGQDQMPWDNKRLLPLRVADACRVLLVRGNPAVAASGALAQLGGEAAAAEEALDGPTMLRFALNPGREAGAGYSTGIETTIAAVEGLARQPLSKYDAVVLYDVDLLPEKAVEDLDAFVRSGKALLIIPGRAAAPMRFNRSLAAAAAGKQPLSPALLGNDRDLATPAGFAAEAALHPLLQSFRDPTRGDISAVKFVKLREWLHIEDGAEIVARADNGMPLIIAAQREQGSVMLLAFSLELDRGNLGRTRVFPPLMWRLLGYLSGRERMRRDDILPAAKPVVLDVSEREFALETALAIAPAPTVGDSGTTAARELPIAADRTLLLDGLEAGGYLLQKPRRGSAVMAAGRPLAVVPDAAESLMAKISADELRKILGVPLRVVADARGALQPQRGAEFFLPLAMALACAYALEAFLGFLANARRERQRLASSGGERT